jgi:hypothetical protein
LVSVLLAVPSSREKMVFSRFLQDSSNSFSTRYSTQNTNVLFIRQQTVVLISQSLAEFTWSLHRCTPDHPFIVSFLFTSHRREIGCFCGVHDHVGLPGNESAVVRSSVWTVDISTEFAATFFTLYSPSGKTNGPVRWAIQPSWAASFHEARGALYVSPDWARPHSTRAVLWGDTALDSSQCGAPLLFYPPDMLWGKTPEIPCSWRVARHPNFVTLLDDLIIPSVRNWLCFVFMFESLYLHSCF